MSLEHLSMEELIRAADVSRTSTYRHWPTKDLFAADLLLTLAQASSLSSDIPGVSAALSAIPEDFFDDLDSKQGRRDAVVEIMRVIMETDFMAMLNSQDWRLYLSLRAAHIGLPDGGLRDRVAEAFRVTEHRFTQDRAAAFQMLAKLLGYRLAGNDPRGWERLSLTVGAVATGMLIRGYSDPAAVTASAELAPFATSRTGGWSTSTLASVAAFLNALEPDPEVEWTAARIAEFRELLADVDQAIRQVVGPSA